MRKKGLKYRMLVWMSKKMIACDEATYLISKQKDDKLSFSEWWKLKMHLLTCKVCRKYEKDIEALDGYFKNYNSHLTCSHHKLSDEGKSKIKDSIKDFKA